MVLRTEREKMDQTRENGPARNAVLVVGDRRVVSFYAQPHPRNFRRGGVSLSMHLGYWDGKTSSHVEALENMNRQLAKRVGLQAGERVLDAGCGYGASAVWLAREVGAEVVGVNIAPDQVYYARRLAHRRGLSESLSFERADFTCTPFPDGSFDVVWALESVCHTSDKEAFFIEAKRLLAPGGRLVVADFLRTTRAFEEEDMFHEWLSGWAVPDLATPEEFEEHARRAGFGDVRLEDLTAGVWPSSRRLYRRALAGYPVSLLQRSLLPGVLAGIRQYRALQRGLWLYGVLTGMAGGLSGTSRFEGVGDGV
jgi:tocopherol O-methyltransferase